MLFVLFSQETSHKIETMQNMGHFPRKISTVLTLDQCMAIKTAFELKQIGLPISKNDREWKVCIDSMQNTIS